MSKKFQSWAAWLLLSASILLVILLSRIRQPVVDQHSFRQCQTGMTAYWFDWKKPAESFFNYETPELGAPWKVPFEFPIYQAAVSAVAHLFGLPIHTAGRLTNLAFFLLTLLPLASLSRGLGLERRFFFIAATLWLCSPLYLYWSRTVMIESTAVFFGFGFLAAVERALTLLKWQWWLTAFVASLACALVKVTTYPAFGLAAVGIFAWKFRAPGCSQPRQREPIFRSLKPLLGIALIGLSTTLATAAWTRHADSVKLQNEISQLFTSGNLGGWSFGTLAQKTDPENWMKILDRSIPEAIGAWWVLVLLLGVGCFLRGRRAALLAGLLVLFLLPFAVFTNLHLVHNYYQYANSFWLILALGLVIAEMSKRVPLFLSVSTAVATLAAQIHTYSKTYYPLTRLKSTGALKIGKFIAAESKEKEVLLIIGDDWSPEVAFFSGRRAVYIPRFLTADRAELFLEKCFNDPAKIFGNYPPAFLVINYAGLAHYPSEQRQKIGRFLDQIPKPKNFTFARKSGYELLKIEIVNNRLQIQEAESGIQVDQSEKPQIDNQQTRMLFDSLVRRTLGGKFEIENRADGIFMHSGASPTEAVFDITGKFQSVRLTGFIAELPPDALDDPQAGTVGVEIFVDGKSQGRRLVDRLTNQMFLLDLSHAAELKVVVDCANGATSWDHFCIGLAK